MACASNPRSKRSSLKTKNLMQFAASVENVAVSGESGSGSDVEVIGELKCNMDDHRCDLCSKGEFLVDKLSQYGAKFNNQSKYMCGICDKNFNSSSAYRKHIMSPCSSKSNQNASECEIIISQSKPKAEDSSPATCTICNKTLKSQNGLFRHHLRQHSGVTHVCSVCKEVFSSFKKFTYHCYQHEFSTNKKYRCLECGEKFSTKSDFNKHKKLHEP